MDLLAGSLQTRSNSPLMQLAQAAGRRSCRRAPPSACPQRAPCRGTRSATMSRSECSSLSLSLCCLVSAVASFVCDPRAVRHRLAFSSNSSVSDVPEQPEQSAPERLLRYQLFRLARACCLSHRSPPFLVLPAQLTRVGRGAAGGRGRAGAGRGADRHQHGLARGRRGGHSLVPVRLGRGVQCDARVQRDDADRRQGHAGRGHRGAGARGHAGGQATSTLAQGLVLARVNERNTVRLQSAPCSCLGSSAGPLRNVLR